MAGPCIQITLTEKGRLNLMMVLTILNGVDILLSFALLATGTYIKLSIEEKINLIGDYNNDILPWVLVGLGCLSLIVSIIGILASTWCQDLQKRSKIRGLLLPYISVALFLAICVLASALLAFAQISHIHRSFGIGIGEAMRKYKYEKELKEQIDALQISYGCCGMKSYEDWFRLSWIHEKFLNVSAESIKAKLVNGEYYNDDAPFSCCNPESLRPCIHHHVHHNNVHYDYDYRKSVTLHKTGCQEALAEYFHTILINVGSLIIAIFCIQLLLALLMRYLQTSVGKAYELGEPTLDAPGWLFGPCGKDAEDMEDGEDSGEGKRLIEASGSDAELFVKSSVSGSRTRSYVKSSVSGSRTRSRSSRGSGTSAGSNERYSLEDIYDTPIDTSQRHSIRRISMHEGSPRQSRASIHRVGPPPPPPPPGGVPPPPPPPMAMH